ncbi:hypothetical protein EHQ42_04645, partial [Leptospira levettii]|uniref:phosphoribosyltransferase-like protein n=1 Tax=Leptospira levettii TaxID=2023178 RepID=UPI0011026E58
MTLPKLGKWLNNFTTEQEIFFSAVILNNLLYRSNDHIKSLLKEFVYISARNIVQNKYNINVSIKEFLQELSVDKNKYNIYFIPSISNKEPLYKSGPHISRVLQKDFHINDLKFINREDLEKKFNKDHIYIFFDDFSGTGEQFILNMY